MLVGCGGVGAGVDDLFAIPGPQRSGDAAAEARITVDAAVDRPAMEAAPSDARDRRVPNSTDAALPDGSPSVPDGNGIADATFDVPDRSENGESDTGSLADAGPVDVAQPDRPCVSTCDDKRVFVTSKALLNGSFAMGSVGEADRSCQAAADERGFGGTWRAWISDSQTSPGIRFTRSAAAYRLLDGTLVASGWADLTSGKLAHGIDLMESGMRVPNDAYLEVWTGTSPDGLHSGNACADWTNSSHDLPYGDVGTVGRKDNGWTQAYRQFCDRSNIHLYCFEQ